ncbi:MAG: hypothetical protein ACXW1W_13890 [Methylococcaceae bacterium]
MALFKNWETSVSNETGVFINETLKPEETNQSYFFVKKGQFCYNPYRINVGSIGLNRFDFDNQIIAGLTLFLAQMIQSYYLIFYCHF